MLDDALRGAHPGVRGPAATSSSRSATPGCGMDARDPGAHLRAVLHDQGGRPRHRAGPRRRARHRRAARRPHRRLQRAGRRHHVQDLPARDRRRGHRGARRRRSAARGDEVILLVEDEDSLRRVEARSSRSPRLHRPPGRRRGPEALRPAARPRRPGPAPGDRRRDAGPVGDPSWPSACSTTTLGSGWCSCSGYAAETLDLKRVMGRGARFVPKPVSPRALSAMEDDR